MSWTDRHRAAVQSTRDIRQLIVHAFDYGHEVSRCGRPRPVRGLTRDGECLSDHAVADLRFWVTLRLRGGPLWMVCPPRVVPMLAFEGPLPVGDRWAYETKWDYCARFRPVGRRPVGPPRANLGEIARSHSDLCRVGKLVSGGWAVLRWRWLDRRAVVGRCGGSPGVGPATPGVG